ncbi:MAG TPA: winged helix-turn-helix domain-containing protein [Acidobacteriota bacterium]
MSERTKHFYGFGPFCLDATERQLLLDGKPVPLTPKAFDTLLALVESNGRMVEKEELIKKVWPDTFIEEANLAYNISILRKVLSEDPAKHQYIETIPKYGYRFVAAVKELSRERADLILERHTRSRVVVEEEEGASAPGEAEQASSRFLLRSRRWSKAGVFSILAALVAVASIVYFANSREAIDSIAVLPFVNASGDPDIDYLSDGITESLISNLSRLPNLKVMSRSSVFRYKVSNPQAHPPDPLAVGRELKVRAVLTGRIVQRGDNLTIGLELVDARDNHQLWGEQYHRKLSDVLAVQADISREISGKLRLKLSGAQNERLARHSTQNTDAYQLYLKGRYFWNKRTGEGLEKSIGYFKQAVDRDPNYALAYAGLADSYAVLGVYEALPPRELFPKAKEAVTHALEIDDTLAEAHASLANAIQNYDWDWAAAEREYRRSIELSPNYATARQWYALYLDAMGRTDEAIAQIRKAQELDPLSMVIAANLGLIFYHGRHYDRAIEECRKALELDSAFSRAHWYLGLAYAQQLRFEEAIAEFQQAARSGDVTFPLATLGHAYARAGRREEAQKVLSELMAASKQRYISPYAVATVYIGLGDKDRAFEWLEKAYQDRSEVFVWLKVEPLLDDLRPDPRFAGLMRRVGLAPQFG